MFEDLMHDLATTFAERFLRLQVRLEAPPAPPPSLLDGQSTSSGPAERPAPRRRYNELGILEDIPEGETVPASGGAAAAAATDGAGTDGSQDSSPSGDGAAAARKETPARQAEIVGLKPQRSAVTDVDWSNVGRNDPCPCGSGRKFKKCHGQVA